jgi:hypothetical protein
MTITLSTPSLSESPVCYKGSVPAHRIAAGVFAALLALSPSVVRGAGFEGISMLGGSGSSRAYGISPDGSVVVGQSNAQAFRWEAGVLTGLGFLTDPEWGTGNESQARAASNGGATIVGGAVHPASGFEFPVVWQGGPAFYAGNGLGWGWANDVSHDGSVAVGTETGLLPPVWPHAFQWVSGTASSINDPGYCDSTSINQAFGVSGDGSVIAASQGCWSGQLPGQARGFFVGGSFEPTGLFQGHAASSDGSVLAGVLSSIGVPAQAHRWEGGVATPLGTLPGGNDTSQALDVSGDGALVVGYATTNGDDEAFVWTAASGMQRLADVLAALGAPATGWTLWRATGISGDGSLVVGYGLNPLGAEEGFVASLAAPAVPALGPVGLAVAALLLLAAGSWCILLRP